MENSRNVNWSWLCTGQLQQSSGYASKPQNHNLITLAEVMNIWESYMWTAEWRINEGWSSQLYTQLLQLRKESLKTLTSLHFDFWKRHDMFFLRKAPTWLLETKRSHDHKDILRNRVVKLMIKIKITYYSNTGNLWTAKSQKLSHFLIFPFI